MEENITVLENPSAARNGGINQLIQLKDFVTTLENFRNNIEDSFLNAKKGDTMIGPLRLTEGQNYGTEYYLNKLLEEEGRVQEGEIFFEVKENLEDFFPVASISQNKIKSSGFSSSEQITNLSQELESIYAQLELLSGGDLEDLFEIITNDQIDAICGQVILKAEEVEF